MIHMTDVYKVAIRCLKQLDKQNPNKTFRNSNGESLSLKQVISEISRVAAWMYPELSGDEIVKVVRCKDCQNFKTYKQKGVLKPRPFRACKYDLDRRDPEFYCKDGFERIRRISHETEDRHNEKLY